MNKHKLYGAILGDLVGKPYEMKPIFSKEFDWHNPENHYTDDTIMTLATAHKLLNDTDYTLEYKWWGNKYYGDYYGKNFKEWLKRKDWSSNDSWGNGAGMRVSPIGYKLTDNIAVAQEAILSANSSHDNDQARRGAIFIAQAIHLLDRYKTMGVASASILYNDPLYYGKMEPIQKPLERFERFQVSCDKTVPIAYKVFLQTRDSSVEDCIRLAVSLGGDCDTIASMAAELWVAHKGELENKYVKQVEESLDDFQLSVLHQFNQ